MATWFISDTHFGHKNIIRHCSRPFNDIQEMDSMILDNINNVVMPKDTLWHLGDFAWGDPEQYLDKIKCNKINLVFGNHDKKYGAKLRRAEEKGKLKIFYGFVDTKFNGIKFTLCHYPMRSWSCSCHGAIQLYGHVHNSEDKSVVLRNQFNLSVEVNKYRPRNLFDILEAASAAKGKERQRININFITRFLQRLRS